jgi:hypothetical protein
MAPQVTVMPHPEIPLPIPNQKIAISVLADTGKESITILSHSF